MYLIKNIQVDGDQYVSSTIVSALESKSVANARQMMKKIAFDMVRDEFGRDAFNEARVIEIHNLDQINEPEENGMLLYVLTSSPDSVLVYQKKSLEVIDTGYIWNAKVKRPVFKRTNILEIEFVEEIRRSSRSQPELPPIEMVPAGPTGGIQIPKPMRQSPICDLISELKNSARFQSLSKDFAS